MDGKKRVGYVRQDHSRKERKGGMMLMSPRLFCWYHTHPVATVRSARISKCGVYSMVSLGVVLSQVEGPKKKETYVGTRSNRYIRH